MLSLYLTHGHNPWEYSNFYKKKSVGASEKQLAYGSNFDSNVGSTSANKEDVWMLYDFERIQQRLLENAARLRRLIIDLKREAVMSNTDPSVSPSSMFMFAPRGFNRVLYQKYVNVVCKYVQNNSVDSLCNNSSVVLNNINVTFKYCVCGVTSGFKFLPIIVVNNGELVFYPGCYPWELWKEYNTLLNTGQKDCVRRMLVAEDYVLLLGMPGTGKTSMLTFAVRTLIAKGMKVLISAYTHSAVENLLLKLIDCGVTPDICMRVGGSSGDISFVDNGGVTAQNSVTDSSKSSTSDEDILRPFVFQSTKFAPQEKGTTDSGVARLAAYLANIRLVASTVLTAGRHELVKLLELDWSIIDEAGQITQPACIGGLLCSARFALVGDHYQLPPLVVSAEASSLGLDISLFRRLAEAHPEAVVYLTQQYRMNSDIMSLSNQLIYDERLICGTAAVADSLLELPSWNELSVTLNNRGLLYKCIDPRNSVVFVDTDIELFSSKSALNELLGAENSFGSNNNHGSGGVVNILEISLIFKLVQLFGAGGITDTVSDIGVISPFRAQVSAIQEYFRKAQSKVDVENSSIGFGSQKHSQRLSLLEVPPVCSCETSTIDKYQGRDKRVIILSTVKGGRGISTSSDVSSTSGNDMRATEDSNYRDMSAGNLLRDWRRINVAITRAKQKLIIIGSSKVLQQVPVLQEMVEIMSAK